MNGSQCHVGTRKTGQLILNRVPVPGFRVALKCYDRIPSSEYGYWDQEARNGNTSIRNGNIVEHENEPRKGYWVSRDEKERIDTFLNDFFQRMTQRVGRQVSFGEAMPDYYSIRQGTGIVVYTNRGDDTAAKHVISEMTNTPLEEVLDVDELQNRAEAQFRAMREHQRRQGPPPYTLNYTSAERRAVPRNSVNAVSREPIVNGTQMVNFRSSNGTTNYPHRLYQRSTFNAMSGFRNREGFRLHPSQGTRLATANNYIPYIASVAASQGPETAGAGPVASVETRNQRRQQLANAAERRIQPAEGGRKRTRRTKKSKSRKH
jgi:hypothetical protein